MKSTFYYLHALSALHIGAGQGVGVIDLPIVREKATHLPYVPGSSVKGVLREEMRPEDGEDKKDWENLFGPENIGISDDNSYAGALALGDARLLCLPVRSLAGTFAWATCPFILARYAREAQALGIPTPQQPRLPNAKTAWVADASAIVQRKLVLEDLDLDAEPGAEEWAKHLAQACFPGDALWQGLFSERFAILPDGVFDFLAETATEVRARVRIDPQTRVVQKGALWYEESLPAETLLYGVAAADHSRQKDCKEDDQTMLGKLKSAARLQLGGKATVGHGLVNWVKREA